MIDPTITCPNCKTEIKLTESLAAPLLESTRQQCEKKIAEKEADVVKREVAIREKESAIKEAKEAIDQQVSEKMVAERAKVASEAAKKARQLLSDELEQKAQEITDLKEILEQREGKLAEAQKAQAEVVRKQRELDDAKREIELTVEKKVQESLIPVREKAKQEAEQNLQLKVVEKEEIIAGMQRKIEELMRKSERRSEQLQGEVQELELESLLRAAFPQDIINPVPKGEHGGDVIHVVVGPVGQQCGTILWESKRTKNWSDVWLPKLRDNQRAAKAEVALIVSQVLPPAVEVFSLIDGVWVTGYPYAIPIAIVMRHSLIEIAAARRAADGQQTKMEMTYQYLTGPRFRLHMQTIVEKFADLHEDLEKERKTMTRLWAKREQQIRCVIDATAGMYGDLQGIAGKTLQEIEGLEMQLLNPPSQDLEGTCTEKEEDEETFFVDAN